MLPGICESFELVKQIHSSSDFSKQAFMAFIEVNNSFALAYSKTQEEEWDVNSLQYLFHNVMT